MADSILSRPRALAKHLYLSGLAGWADLRWRFRKPGKPHGLPQPLVISLTSYPKRYDALALTLKTLMSQTVAADSVVLWIAEKDMAALPASVRQLQEQGLSIRATDDLRSYKKIIQAMKAHADSFILTADDDVYYPATWLETFCTAYRPGERTALAYRAHRMRFQGGQLAPYDSWEFEITDPEPGPDVFFTGVGGVLYPPGLLHPDTTDVARLMQLCPSTDDVWLNWMVRLNGGTVRKIGARMRFREWPGSQATALQNSNRGDTGGNDQQIANIIGTYGLPGFDQ